MEWHAGNTLSQTVFTLLYVHHIAAFNPDFIPLGTVDKDPARPLELITLVLRSVVFGLLKSCDLAWREMNSDKIKDVSAIHSSCGIFSLYVFSWKTGKAKNATLLY